MSAPATAFAVRSASGISLAYGPPNYKQQELSTPEAKKECRIMIFSPDGQYFAWANSATITVVSCKDWSVVKELDHPKIMCMAFTPKSTYLMTWEPFAVSNANPQGSPNLHIYSTKTWEVTKNFVHKKQGNWMPEWSSDETVCSKMINNDVMFYENADFEKYVARIHFAKIEAYSLAPGQSPYHVLCYTKGTKGQPSFCRLFRYPKLDGQQALANKGFFQADRVDFNWNVKGNSALIIASTDVDKTGASYYGKQTLHFMGITGNTAMITFNKEGPLHTVEWSPSGMEFCAVYGFMPSQATVYNLKCEPVFDMGTAPRNAIHYNPFGNILLLGGFGNLRGQVELWDMQTRKLINKCDAPDTTLLQWCPDGVHFLTATTAPRLRIANGYKIWHYTGVPIHSQPWDKPELYEVAWQTCPPDTFKPPVVSAKQVAGIKLSEPQVSKQVYRPPGARDRPANPQSAPEPPAQSKAAQKLKKNREAKKNKKLEQDAEAVPSEKVEHKSSVDLSDVMTGDLETDKKIKNIIKKLDAITKLKEQQASGKVLEVNQVAKIKSEDELLDKIKALKLGQS